LLLKEFSYKKRPLKALLDSDFISADFNNSIHSYVKNQNYEFPKWLDEKESSRVKNFFEELGKSDVETQKLAINSFKTEFEGVLFDKKNEYKKQYTLTLKVGFMVGVMLFIMVI
jgi:stage III sporulation protein AB